MDSTTLRPITRRFLTYLGRVKGSLLLSFFMLAVASSLTAAKAWIIQPTVDSFLAGPTGHNQLRLLGLLVLGIFVAQAVVDWLYVLTARITSARIVQAIRTDLFQHLQRQSLGYFTRHSSGEIMARVITDVTVFDSSAVTAMQGLLRNGLTLVALLGVLLFQELKWGLVAFAAAVLAGLLLRSVGRRIVTVARSVQDSLERLARELTEMTGGIAVILGFGRTGEWDARFRTINEEQARQQVRLARIRGFATSLVHALGGVTLAALLLLMGAAVVRGELSEGQLLSFLAVMLLVQAPAQRMAQCAAGLASGLAAGARAFELLDAEPAIQEPVAPQALPDAGGIIEFENVSFAYDREPVLEGLSFRISPGELVVMVGRSGAGKSTVAQLVKRFYDPDGGRVLVDGIDVRDVRSADLCSAVSYVSQDVFLFDDTIEFNIKVGMPEATTNRVEEVCRLTNLTDVVTELPEGLQTVVGERGVRLSGGQRQRIAIARAVLTGARILVLDEATSALDSDSERRVLQNLLAVNRVRTILAITHRLNVADVADRVFVLHEGALVQEGAPHALMSAPGEFHRLQQAADA